MLHTLSATLVITTTILSLTEISTMSTIQLDIPEEILISAFIILKLGNPQAL